MALEQEQLARLQVLVAIARADGEVQPWERTLLSQAMRAIAPTADITIEQLLNEAPSLDAALAAITTPDLQQKVYEEAVAFAQLDGTTPQENRLLEHIRSTFKLASCDASESTISPVDDEGQVDWESTQLSGRSLVLGMRNLIDHSRRARELVLDYALGAAILGLIPFPSLRWLQLVAIAILLLKMMRDIGAHWGFPKGRDLLSILGNLFGGIGALGITLMAWLTMMMVGWLIPALQGLAGAAAYFTLTWTLGQATNQFYMSSSRLDVAALRQASVPKVRKRPSSRRIPLSGRIPLMKLMKPRSR